MFEKYRAVGMCVVPLKNGIPAVKWGQFQQEMPTAEVVAAWEKYNEYALVCGSVSGIIALDIDTDDAVIIDKVYRFLPQSPVNKIGSKGFTAFYRYNGEKTKSWGGVIELLSDKHLTTLPPSKHREKNLHYEWADGVELIGADLPYLTPDFYEFMESLYPSPVRIDPPIDIDRLEYGDVTLDEAASALKYISPDVVRAEWVSIGMALRDEFGDVACGLFHEWSAGGKSYKARNVQAEWRSFNDKGITIATLFRKAIDKGWHRDIIIRPEADTSLADAFVRRLEQKEAAMTPQVTPVSKPVELDTFDPLKLEGLIGDTVRWICSDAMFPQPMLALLNVLSLAGAVFGRTYASPINTRTNVYMVAVAGTGFGKDHSRKKITKLAEACGLGQFVGAHAIISDTGIARSLSENPSQMLMVDEFGKFLQAISDKNAGSWNKKIIKLMMSLYSDSSSVYKHGDYANKKANESITIHSPNLCIYGTTTEKEYVKALSKDAVESGELNRVMAIKVGSVPRRMVDEVAPIPQDLIDRWERFSQGTFSLVTNGSVDVEPKIVGWGNCKGLQWDIAVEQDRICANDQSIAPLWNRRHENISKIAMMFAIAHNKEAPEFCPNDFAIGKHIVDESIEYMAGLIGDGLAENDHEAGMIELLKFIRSFAAGISRSDVTRRFRKYKAREINDMLSSLIEQGAVDAVRVDGAGIKPVTMYKAT